MSKYNYGSGPCGPGYSGPLVTAPYQPSRAWHSVSLSRFGIEPGQTVTLTSRDVKEWIGGPWFSPMDFIFVGSCDLWVTKNSNAGGALLFGADMPCDSFRPGCPSAIDWPVFSSGGASSELKMDVENRGDKVGNFISRIAGNFSDSGF